MLQHTVLSPAPLLVLFQPQLLSLKDMMCLETRLGSGPGSGLGFYC